MKAPLCREPFFGHFFNLTYRRNKLSHQRMDINLSLKSMGPLCISEENLALIGVPRGRRENKQKNVFLINVVKN